MDLFFDEVDKPLPFISYFEISATTEEEHHLVTTAVEETPVGINIIPYEEENKLEFEAEKMIVSMTCIGDEDIIRVLPFISSFELPDVPEDSMYYLPPENTMVVAEETNAQSVHVQEIVLETRTIRRSVGADAERREDLEICVNHEREQRVPPMQVSVVSNANRGSSTPYSFDEFEHVHGGRNADSGYLDNSYMNI